MIVLRPVSPRSFFASEKIFLHSATFDEVLLISTKRLPTTLATILAIVVFPVPEPPQRIMEGTLSCSMRPRSTPCGPISSWPQTSSRHLGRIRSAKGAADSKAFGLCLFGRSSYAGSDDRLARLLPKEFVPPGSDPFPLEAPFSFLAVGWDFWKKVETGEDFSASSLLVAALEGASSANEVQLESMWELILTCLTILPQMGHSTIVPLPSPW